MLMGKLLLLQLLHCNRLFDVEGAIIPNAIVAVKHGGWFGRKKPALWHKVI